MTSVVLVTGGSGFIGRHVIARLRERGLDVHAPSSCDINLLDPEAPPALMRHLSPSHLLHLAWTVEPSAFWHTPQNVVWLESSLRLLRAFAESGGMRAVTVGSCAEYDWSRGGLLSEDAPTRPATLYGAAKLALGQVGSRYAAAAGLSHAHARLFFLFGPGEHPARLVPSVARAILAGNRAPTTAGLQVRDFLPVAEVAEVLARLVDSEAVGPFNIGSGRRTRIAEIVRGVAAAAGAPELLGLGDLPPRADEPAELVADVERLYRDLGWRASTPLADALAETVAWWRRETQA